MNYVLPGSKRSAQESLESPASPSPKKRICKRTAIEIEDINEEFLREGNEILKRASTENENGCWLLNGYTRPSGGRGSVKIQGKKTSATSLALIVRTGAPPPPTCVVRLQPDCPSHCCRPDHTSLKYVRGWQINDDFIEDANQRLIDGSTRDEKGHLLWNGAKSDYGYALLTFRGRHIQGHQLAAIVKSRSEIPEKWVAAHGEGCPPNCVEPSHIAPKTFAENVYQDKIRDGTLPRGSKHHASLIDEEKARQIRDSKGEGSQIQRAERFGITRGIVDHIDRGTSWGYLDNPDYKPIKAAQKPLHELDAEKQLARIFAKCKDVPLPDNVHPEIPNGTSCKIWEGAKLGGYGQTGCGGKSIYTHVATDFFATGIYREKGQSIRHLCGNSLCCLPLHLRKGSRKEQCDDKRIHKTLPIGEKAHNAILDDEKVVLLRRRRRDGLSIAKLAKEFGVSCKTVESTLNGKLWSHVPLEDFSPLPPVEQPEDELLQRLLLSSPEKLNDELVHLIRRLKNNHHQKTSVIASRLKKNKCTIERVINGKTWSHIPIKEESKCC